MRNMAGVLRGMTCLPFEKTWLSPVFRGVCVAHLFSFLFLSFVFAFVLYLVFPVLPMPLDCPFEIAPSAFSKGYKALQPILICFFCMWYANGCSTNYMCKCDSLPRVKGGSDWQALKKKYILKWGFDVHL